MGEPKGQFSTDPKDCVTPQSLADLTDFFWTAETGPYMLNGKEVKTTWGEGKTFNVMEFKDSPFTVNNADKRQNKTRPNPFAGPVSFDGSAIVATVTIEADFLSSTIVLGPATETQLPLLVHGRRSRPTAPGGGRRASASLRRMWRRTPPERLRR